jgi:hypothetical protein
MCEIKDTDAFLINLGTMQEEDGSFTAIVSMSGFKKESDAEACSKQLFQAVIKDIKRFEEENKK